MAENLKTSKYNDGSSIPYITDAGQWENNTTGDAVSKTTNGNKNICPTGWHVPSDAEWTVLTDYLGGASVAGGKLKEAGTTNWDSPNTDATNTSLFTGIPGGYRSFDGNYYNVGRSGNWWSSKEYYTTNAWTRGLYYSGGDAFIYGKNKKDGCSVRCLRD